MANSSQRTNAGDWCYDATIVSVLDGDTIKAFVDLGFNHFAKVSLRIDGINAPEKNTAQGVRSKIYLTTLLPIGMPVSLVTKKPRADDKYGRWLAAVIRPSSSDIHGPAPLDVGTHLIENGYAKAWNGKGKKPV